ncbi:MAG: YdbH domain-containing protein [Erythrobacter sp.]|nr:MAG: YdbH domain-containing protein [Erythrobacter sp.]
MTQEEVPPAEDRPRGRKRRWLLGGVGVFVLLVALLVAAIWFQREQIADSYIADTFEQNDIDATYTVESISPQQQVLTNIVIGDPAAPDLTIERLELNITPRFGFPDLNELRLVRPRLYGSYREGVLSFGELDPLLFTGEEGPVELPDLNVVIEDGRGLLETDYGRVGVKIGGGGNLQDGFNAEVAAVAEGLALPGCAVAAPTLYGRVSIADAQPEFAGPLRFGSLDCAAQGVALADGTVQIAGQADGEFAAFEGTYVLALGRSEIASISAGGIGGEGRFSWREGDLTALYDLAASDVVTAAGNAGELTAEGRVRAMDQFARIEVEGDLAGSDLALGGDLAGALAGAADASEGTLAAPLLDKFAANLARELRGSTLVARFDARRIGDLTSVVIPEARLRGGSRATLVNLARARLAIPAEGLPRFSGDLSTGGDGLPQIDGRMEQAHNGALSLRLAMREYAAGDARLAVPAMTVVQGRDGRLALEGRVLASGPLPGGFAQGLVLPIDGTVSADGALALWSGCRSVGFDSLTVASLTLRRQSLTLCPPTGRPILRYGSGGLQLAAGATSLDLAGELAETPITLRSGAVGFAYPGALSARDLAITLGPEDNAQRFTISELQARLTPGDVGGTFADADIFLASVPLDVLDASGNWSYADVLSLTDAGFVLEDREATDRFEPLVAKGATLTLADSRITANAVLRHPATDTVLSRLEIAHDLTSGTGQADLFIDGVTFGPDLQPAPPAAHCLRPDLARQIVQNGLTCLALGVVSDVRGTVTGRGQIEWNPDAVTSRGSFSSTSLDLDAAFGPIKGASGIVEFSDLLGLTTAPNQRIRVAAINPGIEINNGEVGFQLIDGERVEVTGGSWPFMGGTLTMRPVAINIGVQETRAYVMEITGLQASQFVERMELGNLAASGTFDGVIPIIFDADGNGQLVSGELRSRPPGGHVSYVGELTYEDMGYFANYAFRTLRDLQYDRMEIDMNGPLTGELVTQVRFAGIRQGETAESNMVSRAIAGLPIVLRINIRAPFYKLMTSLRAMYDPAALRDPRDLGLVRDDGTQLRETVDQDTVDALDEAAAEEAMRELLEAPQTDEPDIQPPESEAMR